MHKNDQQKHTWLPFLFCFAACSVLVLVIRTAFATVIATGNPANYVFTEKAPGDAAEVVSTAAGNQWPVTGNANAAYNIYFPFASRTMTRIGSAGADTIVVDTFNSNPTPSGTLSAGGAQTVAVGFTRAALGASQAAGTYTASYILSVKYPASAARTGTEPLKMIVLTSIALTKTADLMFGESYNGDTTKVVAANSTVSNSGHKTIRAAAFTLAGSGGHAYTITLPGSTVTMTCCGGSGGSATKEMTVDTFTYSGDGTIAAGGSETIYVGATRAAPVASQVAGKYTGSFVVTAFYY